MTPPFREDAREPVSILAVRSAMTAGVSGDADEHLRAIFSSKLASVLPDLSSDERERLRARTIATLAELVAHEGLRVRAAVAEIVKDLPRAPRDLILQLARDSEWSIREPIIRLSPMLTNEDLLGLIAAPVRAGVAVAGRANLPEAVSDAIAQTADSAAIKALLENPSAAIRESTLDNLVALAANHGEWHEALVRRPSLTSHAASALSLIVASHFVRVLAERADLPAETVRLLRRRLDDRLHAAGDPRRPVSFTLAEAVAEARVLREENKLTESALLEALRDGQERMAVAMLAVAADVSIAKVQRAIALRTAKGLVSLTWKAGMSMRAAAAIQSAFTQLAPDAAIRPARDGAFPMTAAEMRWHIDILDPARR